LEAPPDPDVGTMNKESLIAPVVSSSEYAATNPGSVEVLERTVANRYLGYFPLSCGTENLTSSDQ
jgi:hypothetical protein